MWRRGRFNCDIGALTERRTDANDGGIAQPVNEAIGQRRPRDERVHHAAEEAAGAAPLKSRDGDRQTRRRWTGRDGTGSAVMGPTVLPLVSREMIGDENDPRQEIGYTPDVGLAQSLEVA